MNLTLEDHGWLIGIVIVIMIFVAVPLIAKIVDDNSGTSPYEMSPKYLCSIKDGYWENGKCVNGFGVRID